MKTGPGRGSASRESTRAAKLAASVVVATFAAGVVMSLIVKHRMGVLTGQLNDEISLYPSFAAFTLLGAIVIARRPRNPMGWLFASVGVAAGTLPVLQDYAHYVMSQPGARATPGVVLAAWVTNWWWYPCLVLVLGLIPLLFPDGRLPSRRWRPLLYVMLVSSGATAGLAMLSERLVGTDDDGGVVFDLANPIGVPGLAYVEDLPFFAVLGIVLGAAMLGALASVVVRFRRAREMERRQMKAFLYAMSLMVVLFLVGLAGETLGGLPDAVDDLLFAVSMMLPPLGAGVALLRYRLYEIDRIISRTVSYAVLTVLLVGVYAAGVVGIGAVMRGVASGSGGDLAVAASTLAVAALSGPLRSRVQRWVDRRFNRARYDATRTVEGFGQRLRDEVDIDSVAEQLRRVAVESLHPQSVSVLLVASGGDER